MKNKIRKMGFKRLKKLIVGSIVFMCIMCINIVPINLNVLATTTSEHSIIASRAIILPDIDGVKSIGEWNDTEFYVYNWEEQNITDGILTIRIGFKYNESFLFVLSEINDPDEQKVRTRRTILGLFFDSDNDVFNITKEHIGLCWNASYFGSYVARDGRILSCNTTATNHTSPSVPVNCTYINNLWTIEAAININILNISSSKLNIIYDTGDEYVSVVSTTQPSEYISFVFSTEKTNAHPVVNIVSPSEAQVVKETITIAGNASDIDGTVQKVEIKIDNGDWITVSGTTSWSYTWDTTKVSNEEHTISVRAYDGYDYSAIKSITVNVNNKKETTKGFVPGFETTSIIAIIGICILLLRKQQKIKLRHKA